jgi:hypothetical protein
MNPKITGTRITRSCSDMEPLVGAAARLPRAA